MFSTEGLRKPDIVAFDLDGTLTESGALGRFAARNAERAVVAGLILAHHFYLAATAIKDAVCPRVHLSETFKKAALARVGAPRPDMPAMASGLHDLGIGLALVSNNSRAAWGERLARHFDFGPGFDAAVFREDMGGHLKPDPGPLLWIGDRLAKDGRPRTIWYVGDMASDMQAAIRANALSRHTYIPVAMGTASDAAAFLAARSEGPYEVVQSCSSLLSRVRALENGGAGPHFTSH